MVRTVAAVLATLLVPSFALADGGSQRVAGTRITAVAEKLVHSLVIDPEAGVAPAFTLGDIDVPPGAVSMTTVGSPMVTPSYIGIGVAVLVNGSAARTVTVGFRVTHFMKTAVAAHDLTAGAVLGPDDLVLQKVPMNGRPSVDPGVLTGRKLLTMLPKGAPLFPEQTAADDMVKAGQPAVLVVQSGTVSLSADVVARTGGPLGSIVTVFNPQTGKSLAAVVSGRGQVVLNLPEVPQ